MRLPWEGPGRRAGLQEKVRSELQSSTHPGPVCPLGSSTEQPLCLSLENGLSWTPVSGNLEAALQLRKGRWLPMAKLPLASPFHPAPRGLCANSGTG